MTKNNLILILLIILTLLTLPSVSAHGADVTADVMVIANESNGDLTKNIAENMESNISVYKFTSEDEVDHQLEHMLGNENKKILVVAYQDTANEFLKDNSEVSDRLIIVNANDNKSIEDGISELINEESSGENHHQDSSTTNNSFNFIVPLVIGLIIGIIIGLGAGIFLMKRK